MADLTRGELRSENRIPKEDLFELYVDQQLPEYVVAERLGFSRYIVGKNLLRHGIPRRSQSEANVLRFERDPEQREILAEHAKEFFTGREQSEETCRKRAQTVYENQSQLSKYEERVRDRLIEEGVEAETLWPLGRFNIDVAVPSAKLAIEIHGGWHWSPKKQSQDRRKEELLERRGWELLVFARNSWSSASRPSEAEFVEIIVRDAIEAHDRLAAA